LYPEPVIGWRSWLPSAAEKGCEAEREPSLGFSKLSTVTTPALPGGVEMSKPPTPSATTLVSLPALSIGLDRTADR
jgi:hypothetical protein